MVGHHQQVTAFRIFFKTIFVGAVTIIIINVTIIIINENIAIPMICIKTVLCDLIGSPSA